MQKHKQKLVSVHPERIILAKTQRSQSKNRTVLKTYYIFFLASLRLGERNYGVYGRTLVTLFPGLLLAAMLCCSPSTIAAEPAAGGDAAITGDTAAAIL